MYSAGFLAHTFGFRAVLMKRLDECIALNKEYQRCFQRTKERLHKTPNERQFEFRLGN